MNFKSEVEKINNLLLIVAMEKEEKAIFDVLQRDYEEKIISKDLNISVKIIKFGRKKLIVSQSGIGNVKAGVSIALIADKLKIDAILSLGVIGALDKKLNIGDSILATKIIQHDSVYSGEGGDIFMAPGELFLSLAEEERVDPVIKSNSFMNEWIEFLLKNKEKNFFSGTVMSGSEFVASPKRKKEIASKDNDSLGVEMEAAGIAMIANQLNIPFTIYKTVADSVNPDGSIGNDYKMFLEKSSANSAEITRAIVNQYFDDNKKVRY